MSEKENKALKHPIWKLGNKADHYVSTAGLKLLLEIHSEDKNETN